MSEGYNCWSTPNNASWNPAVGSKVCRHYMRGNCLYGRRCKFLHPGSSDGQTSDKASSWNQRKCPIGYYATSDQEWLSRYGYDWVASPEFVPAGKTVTRTYSQVVDPLCKPGFQEQRVQCPCALSGECVYGSLCSFLHGDLCDICGVRCLNPFDQLQRDRHRKECMKRIEKDMELSFAIARSKDKTCGICLEVVVDKEKQNDRRFGILPNCSHCFCLCCIRKWRQAEDLDSKVVKSCPECRVKSDFICPSKYWVDTAEDKLQLINSYKRAMSAKNCKYFNKGRGKCPFGNECFYLHALPDGTKVDVGPPRRARRQNADGDFTFYEYFTLWDYLEERNGLSEEIREMLNDFDFESDDESDWSEFDFVLQ